MWKCPQCGEKIVDESDACWNCGRVREGIVDEPPHAGPEASPGPIVGAEPADECIMAEEVIDEEPGDEDPANEDRAPAGPPLDRPLTEAGFATVMLRLLGIYFTAIAIVSLVPTVGRFLMETSRMGLGRAMDRWTFESFLRPVLELIAGIYFLVGGQWVFDKILTPVRRAREDEWENNREDGDVGDTDSARARRAPVPGLRTWTSADRKFTVRARLMNVDEDAAVLQKVDGEELIVPLEKLCEEDRKYVEETSDPE
jgi:hypothetical protein